MTNFMLHFTFQSYQQSYQPAPASPLAMPALRTVDPAELAAAIKEMEFAKITPKRVKENRDAWTL